MPSEREQVARDLADTCVFGGLTETGIEPVKVDAAGGKSYWKVPFIGGEIRVHTPNLVQIKLNGKRGMESFRRPNEAKFFLTSRLIKR